MGLTALAVIVPKGFFPQQDTGLIVGVTPRSAPTASFARVSDRQQAAADVVGRDPDVASVVSFIGADGTNPTPNTGRLSITLKPHDARTADAEAIIARLQRRLAEVEGTSAYLQSVQDLQVDTRTARTQYQYTLEDADPVELAEWAPRVMAELQGFATLPVTCRGAACRSTLTSTETRPRGSA